MLNAKLKNINDSLSKSKVHKMYFLRASASQKGLKGKIRDLKQQFEEFWEPKHLQKNLQRGAGRFSDPKLFRLVLKVSYFLLSIHFGLQGRIIKLHFGDLGLT